MIKPLPYIPGTWPANRGLLSRFLPVLEDGTISAWLGARLPAGSWVLDPFGSSPRLALEAARAGYRVLVTAHNPITRFLVEVAASAPTEAELKAALSELAAARKGDERLETHLQALYLTSCEACGKQIHAEAFLWRKGEDAPYARVYTCPHCGDAGEHPAAPADLERARAMERTAGLHRARVLERVAPVGDPDREYAEEALLAYLPRAVYALATLINRLEGLDLPPERRRLLTALVLAACDAGSSLWSEDRLRPKQLSVSSHFRENNLWQALELAIGEWTETGSQVPCEAWPRKIPEGGICLYEGRLKDLAGQVRAEIPIQAVAAAIPRPNQAFWTLSALWAGWLWGRAASEPFKIGLRRRRYDWAWNASALSAAFHHLADLLPAGRPMLGLLSEPEPSFLTSALTAAAGAGFDLAGLALRTEHDPLQAAWIHSDAPRPSIPRDLAPVRQAISLYLAERGEPTPYLHVHAAALADLADSRALKASGEEADEALRQVNTLIESALTGDARFIHHGAGEGVESGLWALRADDPQRPLESLPDRVEVATVNFLVRKPASLYIEIEHELYEKFPGLLTPSKAMLYQVLHSYAERKRSLWSLRSEDHPAARREELKQMEGLIEIVGARLGYGTRRDGATLIWERDGGSEHVFHLTASALVGRAVYANTHPAEKCVLVLPGGRAALAAYKLKRDPSLAERMRGWRMLKFRLLRSLADIPVLTRQSFEEQLASDPVEQAEGQLMMF
ncbi:MAG: hypothetical protein ACOY0R_20650 [Chloroflexota bacterium]